MLDFRDCLTHKLARVTRGEFKPGKFEEAQQLFQEAVDTYGQGFRGAYLLRESGSDKGIAVILWEDAESMAASGNEVEAAILEKMTPLFAKQPVNGEYEVVCEITPKREAVMG